MKILVTGSAGFLGSRLVPELVRRGHDVMGVDLLPDPQSPRFLQQDLRLAFDWPADFSFDVCIHLASSVGGFLHNAETDGLELNERRLAERVVAWCAEVGCTRILYSSSLCVFDNADQVDDGPLRSFDQRTPYARAKALTEQYLAEASRELVVLRLTNLFGADQPGKAGATGTSHVIPDLLHKIRRDEWLDVLGDGRQVRNFLHVSDAVELIVRVLARPEHGFFNVRTDLQLTIAELARELLKFTGQDKPVRFHPEYLRYEPRPLPPFDVAPIRALGWRPRVVSIPDGLAC